MNLDTLPPFVAKNITAFLDSYLKGLEELAATKFDGDMGRALAAQSGICAGVATVAAARLALGRGFRVSNAVVFFGARAASKKLREMANESGAANERAPRRAGPAR